MEYRLREDERLAEGIRRIADEQVADALAVISDSQADLHAAVHEFRKHCKRMRGLLRLIRPAFPGYAEENARFRDYAGSLSALRDATSMQECLAALVLRYEAGLGDEPFAGIRAWLSGRKVDLAADEEARARLDLIAEELPAVRDRIAAWDLDAVDAPALAAGIRKTYARAARGMRAAADDPTAERFHEWRKRVKYYRYQTGLIETAWPAVFSVVHEEVDRLSELLGDDHDLAVLEETIDREADTLGGAASELDTLRALMAERSGELRAEAMALGTRLFAESPDHHAHRLRSVLKAWEHELVQND